MSMLPQAPPPDDGECYLLLLPNELLAYITNWLTIKELTSYLRTCKLLHFIGNEPSIRSRVWEPQCRRNCFLYPSPEGDWLASFQANYRHVSERCTHCKSWTVPGEALLHGEGVCYRCETCNRGVSLAHAVGCSVCKHCRSGFNAVIQANQPCASHPPGAVARCKACDRVYPDDACDCWKSCTECNSTASSHDWGEMSYKEPPYHLCQPHMLRMSCCGMLVHGISPVSWGHRAHERCLLPGSCPLKPYFAFPGGGCITATHEATHGLEQRWPLFFLALSCSQYYSDRRQGFGHLYS